VVTTRLAAPPLRRPSLYTSRSRAGLLLSLPSFVLIVVLLGMPIVQAGYYSMTNWDGIVATWVGPSAYLTLFENPVFWRVLLNNGVLLLSVPVAILIPLGIATMLNEQVFGWKFFRVIYFLPTAISWVVIGMVASRVFAKEGILNQILAAIGLGAFKTDFLAGEWSAMIVVAVTFMWSMVGTNTIIFLTGMATLDPSLQEAAKMDGAGVGRIFVSITMPQLTRFVQFAFIMTMISAFTALFSLIFVMTGGGPGYGTTTLEFFVYQTAFSKGAFGLGALLGIVLFVIMAAVGLLQLKLLRSKE
jgi:multiple sugar transport system permease protein